MKQWISVAARWQWGCLSGLSSADDKGTADKATPISPPSRSSPATGWPWTGRQADGYARVIHPRHRGRQRCSRDLFPGTERKW